MGFSGTVTYMKLPCPCGQRISRNVFNQHLRSMAHKTRLEQQATRRFQDRAGGGG